MAISGPPAISSFTCIAILVNRSKDVTVPIRAAAAMINRALMYSSGINHDGLEEDPRNGNRDSTEFFQVR